MLLPAQTHAKTAAKEAIPPAAMPAIAPGERERLPNRMGDFCCGRAFENV